jgi:hypothetical protein
MADITAAAEVGRPAVPTNVGPPRPVPVNLDRLQLLRIKHGFSRLDLGPFIVLYWGLTVALVWFGVQGDW